MVRPRKDEARAGPRVENQASGSHFPGMSFPVAVADEGTQVDDGESQKLVPKTASRMAHGRSWEDGRVAGPRHREATCSGQEASGPVDSGLQSAEESDLTTSDRGSRATSSDPSVLVGG